ncbi:MAG: hypothetical protein COU51_02940 [Parcubacteria group bacterium CG10_big_fil_rev_8_21_14_0_10_36_14]|nr:MAG: hypothetical protein COU51_02940 [Parcubacteria group bacterium CG10_big_fil_rev_8_21_14_0_10_36_14]
MKIFAGGLFGKIGTLLLSLLAFIWTMPNTLIGLFVGIVLTFAWPKWKYGMLIFSSGKGISNTVRKFGTHAITYGYAVIFWEPQFAEDRRYLAHEAHHVKQYKMLGPLFLPVYAFFLILSKGSQGPCHLLEKTAYKKMEEHNLIKSAEDDIN